MKWTLNDKDVKLMSIVCPLLKSPSVDEYRSDLCSEPEDYFFSFFIAYDIAKNMPNLHRLRLDGGVVFELYGVFQGVFHMIDEVEEYEVELKKLRSEKAELRLEVKSVKSKLAKVEALVTE